MVFLVKTPDQVDGSLPAFFLWETPDREIVRGNSFVLQYLHCGYNPQREQVDDVGVDILANRHETCAEFFLVHYQSVLY